MVQEITGYKWTKYLKITKYFCTDKVQSIKKIFDL